MNRILFLLCGVLFFAISSAQTIKVSGATSICQGKTVQLSVEGSPNGATFRWRKDGALIMPAQTLASLSVGTTGNYDVIVTSAGDNDTLPAVKITVNPNPVSSFSFTGAGQCSNIPVSFTNTSTGTAPDYAWSFGDPNSDNANTSDLKNPKHTFIGNNGNGNQNFSVRLIVTDDKGCSDTSRSTITMKQVPGTLLDGTGATTYNDLPYFTQCNSEASTFEFTNLSSTKASNNFYQVKWGDATADLTDAGFTTTTHTYGVGMHKLQFIVGGNNGCRDTAHYNVFVGSNPAVGFGNPGNTVICSGVSLTFPVSNTESNPPGTVYRLEVNDGTSPINYTHPAPGTVTHKFNEGSCGINSGNFSNSFQASIVALNPCGTSAATVVPIYVSKKATADFTISPKDTTCVNSVVSFTNTGINANSVSGLGQCTPGRSVWTITPATGWTVNSGNLGNDNGSVNPSVWVAGSTTLDIKFTAAGTYKIKLKTGGTTLCGDDFIEKTICVNPLPVAAFTTNTSAGCLPLTVTTTNQSNLPTCGANIYNWSVSYSNNTGCTPDVSDFDYINGTSATSAAPQFRFNNPGIYTISLYLSNKSSACVSAVLTKQITVRAKPNANFTAPTSICTGSSVSPTATVNNCYGADDALYNWTFNSGSPASSVALNPGPIIYNTPGNFDAVLTVTNECGSVTVTKPVAVKPSPEVIATSDKLICAGELTGGIVFSSATPGASFTWTNSNPSIGLVSSGSGNIPSFIAVNNGIAAAIATIHVKAVLNGCEGPLQSFTITVQPRPSVPVVSSPVDYCVNETATALSAVTGAGNTLKWYSTSTGGTGSSAAPVPNTANATTISYYVSAVNTATGCESPRATIIVNVKPSPKITGSTPSNPSACASANGSITLNGLSTNTNYSVKYNKNSVPVATTISSNSSGVLIIPNLSAGTYSNISVQLNGCPSNEVGPFTLTDPDPPADATAGSNSPVCGGTSILLNASSSSAGVSYSWAGPAGFISNQQNPTIVSATPVSAGNYTVTITRNGCTVSKIVNVVVNAQPAKPIVQRPVAYCLNATASPLQAIALSNHTLSWYDNKDLQNASSAAPLPSTSAAGEFLYYVTQTSIQGCVSDTVVIPVTVFPPVSGNAIGGDQVICVGGTADILTSAASPAGGNGIYQYQWQFSTDNGITWKDISRAASETYTPGNITETTKFRRYMSSAPCQSIVSNEVSITVQGTLDNYDISASQDICPGTQPASLIGGLPVGGSGSYVYEWESSTDKINWIKINGAASVNYQPPVLNTTTYYRRKVISGPCSAYSTVVTITVIPTPVMNPVADLSYCSGATGGNISFTATPSTNIKYTWTNDNPSIGLAASGNGSIPAFTTTNNLVSGGLRSPITATITVTPVYDDGLIHCTGDPVQFIVTVLPYITAFPAMDIPLCSGSSVEQYTPIPDSRDVPGVSVRYEWTVAGNSIDLANGSGSMLPGYTGTNTGTTDEISTITIKTIYSYNGKICEGGSMSYNIIVKPAVTGNNISANQDICENSAAAILKGSAPEGGNGDYRYQWQSSVNNGNTWQDLNGATGLDYDPGVLTTTTQFRRQVITSVCGVPAVSNVVTVQVGADAKALFVAAKDSACAPFVLDGSVITVQPYTQNSTYNWYANGSLIGTGEIFPGFTIPNSHDSISIKLLTTSGCKADSIERKFYTYRVPVPSFTLSELEGCGPLTISINNTTPDASLFTYLWNFGNGQTSTAIQPGNIVFAPNPNFGDTTYEVKLETSSVCDVKAVTKTVLVHSKPRALFTPGSTVGCSPMTVLFNNTSAGVGNRYEWDFGDGTRLSSDNSDAVSHTFITAIRDTFYVKLKAINGCGDDEQSYAIVVSPNTIKLDFAVNGDQETGCSPHTTRFINNSKGASAFTWDFGDGTVINSTKNIDTISHTFTQPGIYNVILRATNGCSDTSSVEQVVVYPSPIADFNITAGCLIDTVRVTNLTTTATSYAWSFGDGATSTVKDPKHLFDAPGNYSITLIAFQFNAPGSICSDTITKTLTLGPSGTFNYSPAVLCNDGSTVFQVQSSNTDSIIFRFGDGQEIRTTSNTVSHIYPNGGVYLPVVTLKNKAGCTFTIDGKDSIRVDKVRAGFHAVQHQVCGKSIVSFNDTSFAYFGKASVQWNFGDGTAGNGIQAQHEYTASGVYPVQLIVSGTTGCSDTVRQQLDIIVHDIPVAAIHVDDISCVGYDIPFRSTVQSGDKISFYQWTLSNGVSANTGEWQHIFNQPGNYNIRFIAGTENGCYDTVTKSIRINPSPVVRSGIDQTICLGTTTKLSASGAAQLSWLPVEGLSCTDCSGPLAAPPVTTPYVVKGTNEFGCSAHDTTIITVIQPLQLSLSDDDSICIGSSSQLVASGASTYNWSPAAGLNNTGISNPVATPTATTRYRVVGYDGYNCFTDTAYVLVAVGAYPTITLGPDLVLATGTQQPLASTVVNGPVSSWEWTPSRDLSCDNCPLPLATVKKDITYVVNIKNDYGCPATDSINIKVFCESAQVFIANAFTPDNDGINDILYVQASGIVQVKSWRIFNRWGEMVFERNNFAPNNMAIGWDGKVRGVVGGPDVFVYTAEVICENGTVYTYKGNVSIVK